MGLNKADYPPVLASQWHRWRLPVIAALLVLALEATGDAGRQLFSLYRPGVAEGELWRLVTAHAVHLGVAHALLNVAGLCLVWYLVGDVFGHRAWAMISLASIVSIDLGLWLLEPELAWYVGLSGVLHGLLAAGLIGSLKAPRPETWALAVILVGKIGYEQFAGPMPGSVATSGGTVVVGAHLYGAVGGAIAAVLCRIRVHGQSSI
jgi:rhomboid family GlyGly-CTERM serine protease